MFVPGVEKHGHRCVRDQLGTGQLALHCREPSQQSLGRRACHNINSLPVATRADRSLTRNRENRHLNSSDSLGVVFDLAQQVQVTDILGVDNPGFLHAFTSDGQAGKPSAAGLLIECKYGRKLAIAAQALRGESVEVVAARAFVWKRNIASSTVQLHIPTLPMP